MGYARVHSDTQGASQGHPQSAPHHGRPEPAYRFCYSDASRYSDESAGWISADLVITSIHLGHASRSVRRARVGTTPDGDCFGRPDWDPISIIAAPRIIAGVLTMPLLVGFANVIGINAGMLMADFDIGLGRETFLYGARLNWHSWDLFYGFAKSVVFGLFIPVISVHMGLRTRGGAEGVGLQTTKAVMFMILSILIIDALFPPLLLQ